MWLWKNEMGRKVRVELDAKLNGKPQTLITVSSTSVSDSSVNANANGGTDFDQDCHHPSSPLAGTDRCQQCLSGEKVCVKCSPTRQISDEILDEYPIGAALR